MYEDLIEKLRNNSSGFVSGDTVRKAANAIEDLEGKHFMIKKTAEWLAEKVPKWIPVTERLPDMHVEVLVCTESYGETVAVFDGAVWLDAWARNTYLISVTHWMPLPAPPALDTDKQP